MKRSEAAIAAARHWEKRAKRNEAEHRDAQGTKGDDLVPERVVSERATEPEPEPATEPTVSVDSDTDYGSNDNDNEDEPTPVGSKGKIGKDDIEIIEIESSDEESKPAVQAPTMPAKKVSPTESKSPFQLLETPSLEIPKDGTTLESIITHKDLSSTFQFNFSIQVLFFLQHLSSYCSPSPRVTFISGSNVLHNNPDMVFHSDLVAKYNIKSLVAPLADRFGTHHTKMMVNFFRKGDIADAEVEIVILTANLTLLDFGGLTQMCWRSGRLKRGATKGNSQGETFQRDFLNYLRKYKLREVNDLANKLKAFDFSPVDVELLASAPGNYDISKITNTSECYGHGKLLQLLRRNKVTYPQRDKEYNVLAQVSSIAAPFKSAKGETASVFSHLLCPVIVRQNYPFVLEPGSKSCMEHQRQLKYEPYIIYPSAKDVSKCKVGWAGGQSSHFNYTTTAPARSQYEQNIKPYLCGWNSKIREGAPAHVKMYMTDNADNWKTLKWVLMCSHNLSKQAWGYPTGDKYIYKVASYELGVFKSSTKDRVLAPVYSTAAAKRESDILVPFTLPPRNFAPGDKPWSYRESFPELRDTYGRTYTGDD